MLAVTRPGRFRTAIMAVLLGSLVDCGASAPRIEVNAEFAGRPIRTVVDSPSAQYYLQHYMTGSRVDPAWDTLLDQSLPGADGVPSTDTLQRLSQTVSTDVASLYLAQRLMNEPTNAALRARFLAELATIETEGRVDPFPESIRDRYLVLFVPGWLYRSQPWTGADFAEARQAVDRLGLQHRTAPLEETGTIEQNARLVADTIREYGGSSRRLLVVSASSGGPSVAYALGTLLTPDQSTAVHAWLNIGGLLGGTPLADNAVRWPKRWIVKPYLVFKGWNYASVESMTTTRSAARRAGLAMPSHVRVINYIGIPLSGQVGPQAREGYRAMRRFGPNDGLTVITEALAPNSRTLVEFGSDHFFDRTTKEHTTIALARLLVAEIEAGLWARRPLENDPTP